MKKIELFFLIRSKSASCFRDVSTSRTCSGIISNWKIGWLLAKTFLFLSKIKALLAAVVLTLIFFIFEDQEKALPVMLLVPSVNSLIGFAFSCGFLGWKYGKTITPTFYILIATVFVLFPAAIVQIYKISFHPWFDRNDFGHLLIIITLFMYYRVLKGYRNHLTETTTSK